MPKGRKAAGRKSKARQPRAVKSKPLEVVGSALMSILSVLEMIVNQLEEQNQKVEATVGSLAFVTGAIEQIAKRLRITPEEMVAAVQGTMQIMRPEIPAERQDPAFISAFDN